MDVTPGRATPGVTAYPRSAVDEFLASGELAARRLEQAIADARYRTERATFATERAEAISGMLHSILQDLRREFADRRLRIEAQAEGIVGAAREEAAKLLEDARRDALPAAAAPHKAVVSLAADGAVPAPRYRWVAAPDPPAEATISREPVASGVAETRAVLTANAACVSSGDPAGAAPAAPEFESSEAHAVAAAPNGSRRRQPAGTSDGAADEVTATIDLTASGPERRRPAFGRLRRSRRRDATPETAGDDEFLDFLRGALVDDGPLDANPDGEPPVDWRWTS